MGVTAGLGMVEEDDAEAEDLPPLSASFFFLCCPELVWIHMLGQRNNLALEFLMKDDPEVGHLLRGSLASFATSLDLSFVFPGLNFPNPNPNWW